jgi:hypothetical protein
MKPDDMLSVCTWPDLLPQHDSALRHAVTFIVNEFHPDAIVAAGSIVCGVPDRASDLDIYVIHSSPYQQRLQRWFNRVPTEVFANPPSVIRKFFRTEHGRGRPSTAHMIATGFPVLRSDILDELKAEAEEWLRKPSPFTQQEDTMQRYFAAGLLEDAEDILEKDPAMANALLGEAVLAMLRYWIRARNGVLPRTKGLIAEVERANPDLAAAARRFFGAIELGDRLQAAQTIADLCVGARGFFEWDSERAAVPPTE